jgi:hypothetical protein
MYPLKVACSTYQVPFALTASTCVQTYDIKGVLGHIYDIAMVELTTKIVILH